MTKRQIIRNVVRVVVAIALQLNIATQTEDHNSDDDGFKL